MELTVVIPFLASALNLTLLYRADRTRIAALRERKWLH